MYRLSHQGYHHRYTLHQGTDGEDTPNYVEFSPRLIRDLFLRVFAAIPCYNLKAFSRFVSDQMPPKEPALPRLRHLHEICRPCRTRTYESGVPRRALLWSVTVQMQTHHLRQVSRSSRSLRVSVRMRLLSAVMMESASFRFFC